MAEPVVSVCISTYNHERYIVRCLESVVSQLPPGQLEVLVGDDGSSDATRRLVSDFAALWPGTVVPVFNAHNLGPSGNLSSLVARATGRYIAHLDGDDYWLPGKLTAQLAALAATPDAPAVLANALVIADDGTPVGFFTDTQVARIDLDYLVAHGNFLCHGSLLYRAEHRAVVLETPVPYIDYMLLIRLVARGALAYLPAPYVAYRWASATSMRALMGALVGDNYWHALLQAAQQGVAPRALRGAVARFYERLLTKCIAQRRFDVAWSWAQRMRRECPVPVGAALLAGVLRVPLALLRHLRRGRASRRFRRASVFYPR